MYDTEACPRVSARCLLSPECELSGAIVTSCVSLVCFQTIAHAEAARWIPRLYKPMKGVSSYDKPGEGARTLRSRGPRIEYRTRLIPVNHGCGCDRERSELKHLSRGRKRKQKRIPQ